MPAFFLLLPHCYSKQVVACYTELLCEGQSRHQQQVVIQLQRRVMCAAVSITNVIVSKEWAVY